MYGRSNYSIELQVNLLSLPLILKTCQTTGNCQVSLSFAAIIMIQVHRDLDHLPQFKNAVITIGTFDGVHLGHQQIIKLLKQEAASTGGESVIITFHPHPRKVVSHG